MLDRIERNSVGNSPQYCVSNQFAPATPDRATTDEARVLMNSFLAKLALGETVRQSRRASSSNCTFNPPKNTDCYVESLSAQLALFVFPTKRYNRAWRNETLRASEQLETLRHSKPDTFAKLMAERFENCPVIYRIKVCDGLNQLLGSHPSEALAKRLKPAADMALAGSGSYCSTDEAAWNTFLGWCYDRNMLGPLSQAYLRQNAKYGTLSISKDWDEAYWQEIITSVTESWGGMLMALTLANQCDPHAQIRIGLALVENVLRSLKSVHQLYLCQLAANEWTQENRPGQLTQWSLCDPVDQLIQKRGSEFVNTTEFDTELNTWIKEVPCGQDRLEAGRRIREWLKDRSGALDLEGLNLTKIPGSVMPLIKVELLTTTDQNRLPSHKLQLNSYSMSTTLGAVLSYVGGYKKKRGGLFRKLKSRFIDFYLY